MLPEVLVGAGQVIQPVVIQQRPQVVLRLAQAAQFTGHAPDAALGILVTAFIAAPHAVDLRQVATMARIGQILQHATEGAGHRARAVRRAQVFLVGQTGRAQFAHQLAAAGVGRQQHGDRALRVLRQPALQGTHDQRAFLVGGQRLVVQMRITLDVGRVGLGVVGRRGLNIRRLQRLSGAHLRLRVLQRPVDEPVGEADYGRSTAAAVGHGMRLHVRLLQKIAQVARTGRREGLVNRLVGVADARPVALRAGQQAQDALLQPAAVLGLVLENPGPAPLQPRQVVRVALQDAQRQADEVREVDAAAIAQAVLVTCVNLLADLCQGQGIALISQQRVQIINVGFNVLRLADVAPGHVAQQGRPVPLAHVAALLQGFVDPALFRARVAAQPAIHRFLQDVLRLALVDNAEVVRQTRQAGPLLHDVVGQAMQGAHAIAHQPRQERAFVLQFPRQTRREIVHGGVDQRHDQHFLICRQAACAHQTRRQRSQRGGLAAARHGGHAQLPAAPGQHLCLRRPRPKHPHAPAAGCDTCCAGPAAAARALHGRARQTR